MLFADVASFGKTESVNALNVSGDNRRYNNPLTGPPHTHKIIALLATNYWEHDYALHCCVITYNALMD